MIKINNNHNKHRKHFAVVLFGSFGTLLKFLRTQYSIAFLWQLSAWWLYWIACVIHFAIVCTYASLISTTISASNILDGNHSGHFYISENIPPTGVRPLELVRGKEAATQQMWNLPPLIDLTGQSECTFTIKASSVRATLKMQYGWICWKIVQALDPDDASMWRSRVRPLWAPTTSQDGRRWISKRNRNRRPRWLGDRRLRLWGRTSRLGPQSPKPRCPFTLDTKTVQRQRHRQRKWQRHRQR